MTLRRKEVTSRLLERFCILIWGVVTAQQVKNLPAMQEAQETRVRSLGWKDPLEKETATLSRTLAWRVPWTEGPGRLQSMGCKGSDKTEPLTDTHTLVYFYVTIYQAVDFFFCMYVVLNILVNEFRGRRVRGKWKSQSRLQRSDKNWAGRIELHKGGQFKQERRWDPISSEQHRCPESLGNPCGCLSNTHLPFPLTPPIISLGSWVGLASAQLQVLVTQLCPTLCNLMDWSPTGSSVCGILQARILEWVAIPSSRGSYWPKDWTRIFCIAGRFFTAWAILGHKVWGD